jgi:hypothetical protein
MNKLLLASLIILVALVQVSGQERQPELLWQFKTDG